MKNFFKKLSFVLAIAMVLTSLTPAVASAASKDIIRLHGSSKAATTVYAWIGGVPKNLDYTIGGKTSGVKGTWTSSNEKYVKVDAKTGVLTPVANGNAKVTFTATNGKKASVTVKARTRAAALHIYDAAEYKAGEKNTPLENKEGVTPSAIEMKVGDKMELKVTMPLSTKQKNAGAKIATYFTYAEVEDPTFVSATLDPESNQRAYTLEAKAVGETTVTIVANQTTLANVRNGKYFREGKITIKVVDAFSAKQTGANKITVTGTNLPTEKADYVLKLGTATKTLKDVVVNEEKTSAVLTTATSTLSDGSYTVTVGDNKAEFTCEEAKVASIVIEPENAIIDAKDRKKAYAYYKVYNQFEEDVTALSLGNSDVTITGSDKATGAKGKVTFESTSDYNMNVSQVSLSIVCRTNGVSVTKILTVGEASKLTTVNFEGVYKKNGGTYTKVTSIPEGLAAAGLKDYYLFFTGVDQYELPYDAASIGSSNLSVTLSSATGLTNGSNNTTVELDNKEYYAMGLTVTGTPGILASGTVKVMGVVLTSGKNFTSDITVDSSVKIDSIRIFAANGVFGDIENEIDYEILDTNGNSITSIDVLSVLNDSKYMKNYPDVKFVGSKDGTAKLKFAPGSVGENGTTVSLSWISPTNKFGYTTLNVRGNQHPKAIIGVDTGLFKASVVATSGGTVELGANNFIYEDQFGNVMSSDALKKNTGYKIEIATAGSIDSAKLQVTTKAAASVASKDKVVTATAIDTTNTITGKFVAKLIDAAGKEVSGADLEFNIYAVNLDDASGISVIPFDTKRASTTGASGSAVTFTTSDFMVVGYYGDEIVTLQAGKDYNLVGVTTVPAISATEGKVTKDTSATIVLKNSKGDEMKVPYSYSNKTVAVISSDAFSSSAPDNQLFAKGYVTLPAAGKITAVSMGALTYTKDLYGGSNGNGSSSEVSDCATPRITFSNLPADTTSYEVANNGTTTAMLTFKKPGWYTVKVKYSWTDGFVYETSITFDASAVVAAQ